MIVTKGIGSNLLITQGYGATGIVARTKAEFVRLMSYIRKTLFLKSELP